MPDCAGLTDSGDGQCQGSRSLPEGLRWPLPPLMQNEVDRCDCQMLFSAEEVLQETKRLILEICQMKTLF